MLLTWAVSLDNKKYSHNRIRRLSIDRFYSLVTGHKTAFKDLCDALPTVISDAIASNPMVAVENSVYNELKAISPDMLTSLYLLAFKEYEGFLSIDSKGFKSCLCSSLL